MGEDQQDLGYLSYRWCFLHSWCIVALVVRTMRTDDEKMLTDELLGIDLAPVNAETEQPAGYASARIGHSASSTTGGEQDAWMTMFLAFLFIMPLFGAINVSAEADIGLEEAGITLVALRNDTLDLNQDGDVDAVNVVVILNSTTPSTFIDIRIIATHNDREVVESKTIEIIGQQVQISPIRHGLEVRMTSFSGSMT